jgi:hypothetical protein
LRYDGSSFNWRKLKMIATNFPEVPACCHPTQTVQQRPSYLQLAEQISIIALALFAANADSFLFFYFVMLGLSLGAYQHYHGEPQTVAATSGLSCSQNFLEQLTQVKLPPLISLGVNVAVTWCHINLHKKIFVPIVALSIGAQWGKRVVLAAERVS